MFEIAIAFGALLVLLCAIPLRKTAKFKPEVFVDEKPPENVIDSARLIQAIRIQKRKRSGQAAVSVTGAGQVIHFPAQQMKGNTK